MDTWAYYNQSTGYQYSTAADPQMYYSQYSTSISNNQQPYPVQNSYAIEDQQWQSPYYSVTAQQPTYQEPQPTYQTAVEQENYYVGDNRNLPRHAWARKDQLVNANPVRGGMGMYLLKKMGWRPGEGLGKNRGGQLEPLKMSVKMDKKGLLSAGEVTPKRPVIQCSGKHPVSYLMELCTQSKWGPPLYTLVFDSGPVHRKKFLFKVRVNGQDYQPPHVSGIKKQAKAQAALICLQSLGLLPKETKKPV